jgi:hypothetical protein
MSKKTYIFHDHITDKPLSSQKLKKHLKKLGISFKEYILKFNNMNDEDLPRCKLCNNSIMIKGSVLRPIESDTCSNKCSRSYNVMKGSRTRKTTIVDGKTLDQLRCEKITNTKKSTIIDGKNTFERSIQKSKNTMRNTIESNGKSKLSNSRTKANLSAVKSGRLPKTKRVKYYCEYSNKTIYFDSKSELYFYKRFKRLLNKYYSTNKSIEYELGDRIKNYIPDYYLKDE